MKRQSPSKSKAVPEPPKAYGEAALDYNEYLKIPELLELQQPLSKPAHHDETFFIIIHQAFELWFKLVLQEIEGTIQHMREGELERAHHKMRRVVEVFRLFVPQIHLLETMRPIDFLEFRDNLKPASGFQSLQFREIEFLAGLKDPVYYTFFKHRPEMLKRLKELEAAPDLGTAYVDLLRRLGFRVPTITKPRQLLDDEATRQAIVTALLPVYETPEDNHLLYLLTERLLEFDEVFALWRQHHVNVVERIIGFKVGTGGSSGASYLRTTTSKRAFPFLWDLRTRLEVRT